MRQLTYRIYLILAPRVIIVFPILVRNQPWDRWMVAFMVAALLLAAWFAWTVGTYVSVLIVRRDRKRWYSTQKAASLGTLALLVIFWTAHWLNPFTAILINISGIVCISQVLYFRARHLLGVKGNPSRDMRAAIIHTAPPSMSGAVFYSLQGQVSILLITVFGHTDGVANIGALGRLSQVYGVFTQLNPLLRELYFSKLHKSQFKASYFALIIGEVTLCVTITGSATLFPKSLPVQPMGARRAGAQVR